MASLTGGGVGGSGGRKACSLDASSLFLFIRNMYIISKPRVRVQEWFLFLFIFSCGRCCWSQAMRLFFWTTHLRPLDFLCSPMRSDFRCEPFPKGGIGLVCICMSERLTHDLEQLGRHHAHLVDKKTWTSILGSNVFKSKSKTNEIATRASQLILSVLGMEIYRCMVCLWMFFAATPVGARIMGIILCS